jgi:hypothetical protein
MQSSEREILSCEIICSSLDERKNVGRKEITTGIK